MNLPNKLTVSRFALTGAFLWAMFSRSPVNDTLALVFFCLAGVTDFLDGEIARRRNLITSFGTLMDPLADKVMTCSAFIALIERHMISPPPTVFELGAQGFSAKVHAWMVVIIVARELAITGLRLLAASKNVVLAAERYGKHKTISQIAAIIALLVMDASVEWWPGLRACFQPWVATFAMLALWLTVLLTFTSGALYLWRNREVYLKEM
jgi:CDP-diacylglycerol---glycerol-3-phosphate 3-phosphatidyltransferase